MPDSVEIEIWPVDIHGQANYLCRSFIINCVFSIYTVNYKRSKMMKNKKTCEKRAFSSPKACLFQSTINGF